MVKLSLLVTVGVVVAYFTTSTSYIPCYILLASTLLLFVNWIMTKTKIGFNYFFGILTVLIFILLGYVNYKLRTPDFIPKHYVHFIKKDAVQQMHLKVTEILKPNRFYFNYLARVISVDSSKTSGNILISLKKDTLANPFFVDEELLVNTNITQNFETKNPFTFNYASFLKDKGIFSQARISSTAVLARSKGKTSLKGWAEKLRNKIILKLKENNLASDELAILEALLLGKRTSIRKELNTGYQNAGASHILAVSGLHVGILMVLFSFLLHPLTHLKKGNVIKAIGVVILLWVFALIAGLSASVVRATTMFTFLMLAKVLKRETSTINTLFLSYFFLVLINPFWLFQVGFQLSYMAVFFIVWLHPLVYTLYAPRFYLDKLFWGIISITLVVQIGLTPLLLYYFHQFSALSFLTNLMILPFLGIILGIGVLIIALALLGYLPHWISAGFNVVISVLNKFILWVGSQESFIIKNISFSIYQLIGYYLVILTLILFWKQKQIKNVYAVIGACFIVIAVSYYEKYITSTNELVIFNKPKNTLIGYKNGKTFQLFTSDSIKNYYNYTPIKEYLIAQKVKNIYIDSIPSIFKYRDKFLLIIDSTGIYPVKKTAIILLINSPKINLERALDSLQPDLVIADASNYFSYVNRWEKTCKKRKLPFYYTGTKGAFIKE
jgi:competence protein ComEC